MNIFKKVITIITTLMLVTGLNVGLSYAVVSGSASSDTVHSEATNDNAQIVPFDNRHYIKVVRGAWSNSKIITVTEKQAKRESTYKNVLVTGLGIAVGVTTNIGAGLAGFIVTQYYTSPTSAAGNYYVNKRSIKRYSVDRLTGKMALLEKKTEFKIIHDHKVTSIVL